jgi:type IV pilus assembly protein PilC
VIDLVTVLLAFVLYVALGLVPAIIFLYLIYHLLTLPLRRNERTRIFLDLLQLGMDSGQTPEQTIVEAAATGDRALGSGMAIVARALQQGLPLGQALDRAPRLLPPQVRAMLKTGAAMGDVRSVLPACRLALHGGISQVRGALNYLLVLSFLATPFMIAIPVILKVKVIPSFQAIFAGMMEGSALPAFTRFVLATNSYFIVLQVALTALVWLLTLCYLGGPRLRGWVSRVFPLAGAILDRFLAALPWRRKRLQRDFSSMLAVSLEAGLPEAQAVRFAGEATANALFRKKANRAASLLAQGVKLPEALRVIDRSGELKWRLTNALGGTGGFVKALAGWHEALDAKAFQLEQTAAQTTTTLFVLLNGLVVAAIVIGMFLPLIALLNRIAIW